jgi:hypothetical protein
LKLGFMIPGPAYPKIRIPIRFHAATLLRNGPKTNRPCPQPLA